MSHGYVYTSISGIGNGFIEVSLTKRNVALVGLDNDLSKKSIPIGSDATFVYLPDGNLITKMN